jgi:hypothetical protein
MKACLKVKGLGPQARFWIRVFELEPELQYVQAQLNQDQPPGDVASVPVVAEYTVDENLKFFYMFIFRVDRLGPSDFMGVIFFGDKAHWETLAKDRDEIADETLKEFAKTHPLAKLKIVESPKQQ